MVSEAELPTQVAFILFLNHKWLREKKKSVCGTAQKNILSFSIIMFQKVLNTLKATIPLPILITPLKGIRLRHILAVKGEKSGREGKGTQ